jgi:hypothetical protein
MSKNKRGTEKISEGEFASILTDFVTLANEVKGLKLENRKLMEKLYEIEAKQLRPNVNSADIDYIISKAVKTAIEKTRSRSMNNTIMKKFERKKKELIKHKILELAETKQYTIPEIKEVLVDKECYCSKASFYRYIEKLKWKGHVDFIQIDERRIIVPKQIKNIQ